MTNYDGLQILIKQTMQHPILSKEEEFNLLSTIKLDPDEKSREKARQKLILHNQRSILNVAKRYGKKLPLVDRIQEGNIGLMKAIEKFNINSGYRLSTYAYHWIRQAISRAAEAYSIVRKPPQIHSAFSRIQKTRKQLIRFHGEEPTQSEIAEALGMSKEEMDTILTYMREEQSLDETNENGTPLGAFIPDDKGTPEDFVSDKVFKEQLYALIHTMDKRRATILEKRIALNDDPLTLDTLGKQLGISRERVRQLESEAKQKIKKQIEKLLSEKL